MNSIDKINKLSKSEFVTIFGNIFENSEWIAMKAYDLKPFIDLEDFYIKIANVFDTANEEEQLKVIRAHPDLADKTKIGKSLTNESQKEQMSANLDQCTENEYIEFKNLNIEYKKKFGFPFIFSIKGKNKNEILDNFRKRSLKKRDEELFEAKLQVKKIANLRLKEKKIL
tara:strand:+ start:481 stop:990 length:510 start_codon:yes stop_codon:yes gene_type:complete